MKTNLDVTIKNIDEAKSFLKELYFNGESYHPEEDANDVIWLFSTPPSKKEKKKLNMLMEKTFDFKGFDPCEFIFNLDRQK